MGKDGNEGIDLNMWAVSKDGRELPQLSGASRNSPFAQASLGTITQLRPLYLAS